MAIRKHVIKNLHHRHVSPKEAKVFIRCSGETRLRDLDDFDRPRSREAIVKKYGPLERTWFHLHYISLRHWGRVGRLFGSKIRPEPRDRHGNAEYDFDLWRSA